MWHLNPQVETTNSVWVSKFNICRLIFRRLALVTSFMIQLIYLILTDSTIFWMVIPNDYCNRIERERERTSLGWIWADWNHLSLVSNASNGLSLLHTFTKQLGYWAWQSPDRRWKKGHPGPSRAKEPGARTKKHGRTRQSFKHQGIMYRYTTIYWIFRYKIV